MIPPLVRPALAVLLLPLAAATLRAQDTTRTERPDTIVVERPTVIVPRGSLPAAPIQGNLVSIQPLAVVALEVYQGEYERVLSPTVTLGVGGSLWNHMDVHYRSADLKLRYYPGARALRGFSFGASAGFTSIADDQGAYSNSTGTYEKSKTSGPTVATLLEYGWLLGPARNFHVGLGVGAKVIFAKETNTDGSGDTNLRYPTARVSIGWAF